MQRFFAITVSLALSSCIWIGDGSKPIPTLDAPATQASGEHALVVVLPGFGVDAQDMKDRGVGDAIHKSWPQADVLLASATFDYYRTGKLVGRLHDEIIQPARSRGYQRIWLAGASMGGMGVLLYEREHPGELDGLVLFSPYLGSGRLLDEIRQAGGVDRWDPGPLPPEMTKDNFERQVWKMIKGWSGQPGLRRRVWLACGADDHLIGDVHVLSPALPADHYLERPGGHWWSFFLPAATEVFGRIREQAVTGGQETAELRRLSSFPATSH